LESLKAGVVLREKIGSKGSFAERSVGIRMISDTVQLFTVEVSAISTVDEN